jgi:malonate decarboxylase beta subunit
MIPARHSYLEATARARVRGLLDAGSFRESCGPSQRLTSPHLPGLGMPVAFDDGIVVGEGTIEGRPVLIAAQEGAFMGGAVGEVHGAKLTGLLERARDTRPDAVVLLLDSGGVRLHEANAGLIAMGEIQRAVFDARAAGIAVIAVIGGRNGCYGGTSILARSCDRIIAIEAVEGIEEFDAQDRALVWRTMGAKHRRLIGEIDEIVADDIDAFRGAIAAALGAPLPFDLDALEAEHARLADRIARFGGARDAREIWAALGVNDPDRVSDIEADEFNRLVAALEGDRQ